MSTALVSRICKEKGGFRTPELNEKLYLHYRGFAKIENLEEFTACRVLWLENNIIEEIENLEALTALDSLYLQHNKLRTLGTVRLTSITTLNVSFNSLDTLDAICNFPSLMKLHVAHNNIASLAPLVQCASLTVVDAAHNVIEVGDELLSVVGKLSKLASLMLQGNPVVRAIPAYRKTVIHANPNLKYLDEYPVFADEARCVAAYHRGGIPEEKAERSKIRQEEEERCERQRSFFAEFVRQAAERGPVGTPNPPSNTRHYELNRLGVATNAAGGNDDDDDVYVPKVTVAYKGKTLSPAAAHAVNASPSKSEALEQKAATAKTLCAAPCAAEGAAAPPRRHHVDPMAAAFPVEEEAVLKSFKTEEFEEVCQSIARLFSQ